MKTPTGSPCFAYYLKGDAARFVEELSRMQQGGEYVNKKRSHEILVKDFGVDVSISGVLRHFRALCKCDRRSAG